MYSGRMSNYRGLVPGTFTMGNVVCGFLSLLSSFEHNVTAACWFVVLAAFLDALDGKVARLSGSSSRFGVELDSLADLLSFGVAPAMIVYSIKLSALGKWGWIISIVYIMAASYRLARYNLLADSEEKKDFVGLPVPAAALALVSFVIFCYDAFGELEYSEYLVSMIVLFAFLMVSQVQYESLPDRFDNRPARIRLAIMIVAAIAVLFRPRLLLFPVCASYILVGMIRELYRLMNLGVVRVTSRHPRRRKTDRMFDHEQ